MKKNFLGMVFLVGVLSSLVVGAMFEQEEKKSIIFTGTNIGTKIDENTLKKLENDIKKATLVKDLEELCCCCEKKLQSIKFPVYEKSENYKSLKKKYLPEFRYFFLCSKAKFKLVITKQKVFKLIQKIEHYLREYDKSACDECIKELSRYDSEYAIYYKIALKNVFEKKKSKLFEKDLFLEKHIFLGGFGKNANPLEKDIEKAHSPGDLLHLLVRATKNSFTEQAQKIMNKLDSEKLTFQQQKDIGFILVKAAEKGELKIVQLLCSFLQKNNLLRLVIKNKNFMGKEVGGQNVVGEAFFQATKNGCFSTAVWLINFLNKQNLLNIPILVDPNVSMDISLQCEKKENILSAGLKTCIIAGNCFSGNIFAEKKFLAFAKEEFLLKALLSTYYEILLIWIKRQKKVNIKNTIKKIRLCKELIPNKKVEITLNNSFKKKFEQRFSDNISSKIKKELNKIKKELKSILDKKIDSKETQLKNIDFEYKKTDDLEKKDTYDKTGKDMVAVKNLPEVLLKTFIRINNGALIRKMFDIFLLWNWDTNFLYQSFEYARKNNSDECIFPLIEQILINTKNKQEELKEISKRIEEKEELKKPTEYLGENEETSKKLNQQMQKRYLEKLGQPSEKKYFNLAQAKSEYCLWLEKALPKIKTKDVQLGEDVANIICSFLL